MSSWYFFGSHLKVNIENADVSVLLPGFNFYIHQLTRSQYKSSLSVALTREVQRDRGSAGNRLSLALETQRRLGTSKILAPVGDSETAGNEQDSSSVGDSKTARNESDRVGKGKSRN